MESKVFPFPVNTDLSVAERLRELAAQIETGQFGEVHSITLVADLGGDEVQVVHYGNEPLPGPTAHLMLHMGMLKLAGG